MPAVIMHIDTCSSPCQLSYWRNGQWVGSEATATQFKGFEDAWATVMKPDFHEPEDADTASYILVELAQAPPPKFQFKRREK